MGVRVDSGDKGKGKGKGKSDKGYGKGKGDRGDKGKGKGKKGPRDTSEMPPGCQSVIVKNLSYDTVESTLQDAFQDCGGIEGVRVLTDRDTGRSRGIGFIDFETTEGAIKAMGKSDVLVDGRAVFVDWTTPRPDRP